MKIVATVMITEQIGPDDWRVYPISWVFDSSVNINEILEKTKQRFHDLTFSEVQE